MTGRPPQECESYAGRHAGGVVRLFPCGWRCPAHTPAALAGRPETPPGPGWPIHRTPPDEPPGPNPFRTPLPR